MWLLVIGARVTSEIAHWLFEIWQTANMRDPQRVKLDHALLEQRLALEKLSGRYR